MLALWERPFPQNFLRLFLSFHPPNRPCYEQPPTSTGKGRRARQSARVLQINALTPSVVKALTRKGKAVVISGAGISENAGDRPSARELASVSVVRNPSGPYSALLVSRRNTEPCRNTEPFRKRISYIGSIHPFLSAVYLKLSQDWEARRSLGSANDILHEHVPRHFMPEMGTYFLERLVSNGQSVERPSANWIYN